MNGKMWQTHTAIFRLPPVLMLGMLLMACLPVSVHALGFGSLVLSSHLNEELKAEIPLILSASENIDMVHVELASPNDYRQFSIPWQAELSRMKVFIQARHARQPLVVLRSAGTIRSSMLSVLLKAQKNGRGTYYKHFQLLLDPAETMALHQQHPAIIPLGAVPDASVSTASFSSSYQPLRDQGWARIWRYGPVHAGDSLSEIAYRLRRDKRFSNRQVMLSLYKQNPRGFVDGDINQLKQGAWLTVPHGDVVKQYTGKAAMRQLSLLLTRHHDGTRLTARPDNKPKHTTGATTSNSRQHRHSPKGQDKQQLRYSGNIAISGASAKQSSEILNTLQSNVNKQFGSMHAEMMGSKLQMASLGKSVASLNQSMQGIKQDIHALRKDVAMIKNRSPGIQPDQFSNWQVALLALLAGLLGALIALLLRKKPAGASIVEATSGPDTMPVKSVSKNSPSDAGLLANETVQLLNQAEESLGKCEYEKAEQLLTQIDSHSPDSLRASALKAQLYHETDRHDARNDLINSISEESDKQRWERFCNLLPTHVWGACFGGDTTGIATRESNSDR